MSNDMEIQLGFVSPAEEYDAQDVPKVKRLKNLGCTGLVATTLVGGSILAYNFAPEISDYLAPREVQVEQVEQVVEVVEPQVPLVDTLPYAEFKGEVNGRRVEVYDIAELSGFELRLYTDDGCTVFFSNGNDLREDELAVRDLQNYKGRCMSLDADVYTFDSEADSKIYAQADQTLEVLVRDIESYENNRLNRAFCAVLGMKKDCLDGYRTKIDGLSNSSHSLFVGDAELVFGESSGVLPSGVNLKVSDGKFIVDYSVPGKGSIATNFKLGHFKLGNTTGVKDVFFTLYDKNKKMVMISTDVPEDKFTYYESEAAKDVGTMFALKVLEELEYEAVVKRQEIAAEKARVAAAEVARVEAHRKAVDDEFSSILGTTKE